MKREEYWKRRKDLINKIIDFFQTNKVTYAEFKFLFREINHNYELQEWNIEKNLIFELQNNLKEYLKD